MSKHNLTRRDFLRLSAGVTASTLLAASCGGPAAPATPTRAPTATATTQPAKATPTEAATPTAVKEIVLKVWLASPEETESRVWSEIAKGFEEGNPGIKVDLTTKIEPGRPFFKKLQTAIAAKDVPDVTWLGARAFVLVMGSAGILSPLTEYVDQSRFVKGSLMHSIWESDKVKPELKGELVAVPAQLVAELPALAKAGSAARAGEATSTPGEGSGGPLRIENEFYRIEINRATGFVKSILDKELDRELLSDCGPMGLEIGLQPGEEDPHFALADSLAEDIQAATGPVMERAVIHGRTMVRSQGSAGMGTKDRVIRWSRTLSLHKGIKKISIESSFDWDEGISARILEAFPFRAQQPRFAYEVPYGVTPAGGELSDLTPVQKWVALYDEAGGTGVAVASDWMRWRARGSSPSGHFISLTPDSGWRLGFS